MTARAPISRRIKRLRQRQRNDRSWRIWWEPEAAARALGFAVVELDADRPTWSAREANRLNAELEAARSGGGAGTVRRGSRTMEDLVTLYQKSPAFAALAPKTQADYRAKTGVILRKYGPYAVADFTKAVVHTWYETLYQNAGRHQALALVRMLSILMGYAELKGWRPDNSNPCSRLKLEVPQPRGRRSDWAELDAIVAAADACGLRSVGTAALASMLQGQRQTDVLQACRGNFELMQVRGQTAAPGLIWVWQLVRSKRGNAGVIPLHPEFLARIGDWLMATTDPEAPLLIEERVGRAYDQHLFSKRWQEVRAAAAEAERAAAIAGGTALPADWAAPIAQLQFRDLRRTWGKLARLGGVSRDDIADVLGNTVNTDPVLARTYTAAELETVARAQDAVRRPSLKEEDHDG